MFNLFKGIDRSAEQTINPEVLFSYKYDNLRSSSFFSSTEKIKNILIVSKDENTNAVVYSGSQPIGIDRREIQCDISDLKKNKNAVLKDSDIQTRGYKKLSVDHKINTGFEGEIEPTNSYVYLKDYYVGDKVQFEDSYGNNKSLFISEVVIARDENGLTVTPTFEDPDTEYVPD